MWVIRQKKDDDRPEGSQLVTLVMFRTTVRVLQVDKTQIETIDIPATKKVVNS